ncbi:hypothetical protein [Gordonia sp. MMO-8]|uniref:hypothetical protein n=1 Tax=Gordonia sp. MMO-8 TaxID=3127886 RepID=UPI003019015C
MTEPLFATAVDPVPSRTTERDMLNLLREKYTRIPYGWNADRYVRAEHVRYSTSYGYASRIADYIVLDTYGDSQILGFEVKVSRSDWLTELGDPTKSEKWKQHCHAWYLAVPDVSIVRDDLPSGWGLLAPDKTGKLVIRRRSKLPDPEPMPLPILASLGRAIAQTSAKENS